MKLPSFTPLPKSARKVPGNAVAARRAPSPTSTSWRAELSKRNPVSAVSTKAAAAMRRTPRNGHQRWASADPFTRNRPSATHAGDVIEDRVGTKQRRPSVPRVSGEPQIERCGGARRLENSGGQRDESPALGARATGDRRRPMANRVLPIHRWSHVSLQSILELPGLRRHDTGTCRRRRCSKPPSSSQRSALVAQSDNRIEPLYARSGGPGRSRPARSPMRIKAPHAATGRGCTNGDSNARLFCQKRQQPQPFAAPDADPRATRTSRVATATSRRPRTPTRRGKEWSFVHRPASSARTDGNGPVLETGGYRRRQFEQAAPGALQRRRRQKVSACASQHALDTRDVAYA